MNEFNDYTDRVTLFEDGAYRWHYDMDMAQNKSMLYMLEKINLFTFLGVSVGGAILIQLVEGNSSFARGILLIGWVIHIELATLLSIRVIGLRVTDVIDLFVLCPCYACA